MAVQQVMMMYKGNTSHSVTLSPDPATATTTSPTPCSTNVAAVVSGGVGPFTYSWSLTSGAGVTLTNATLSTCTITTNNGAVQLRNGTLKCDVTDTGNGSLVASGTGSYTLEVL